VLEHYLDGATLDVLRDKAASMLVQRGRHLSREETAVLALLHRRMAAASTAAQSRQRARAGRPRVSARARTA
jgi:hypothetical protein